MDQFLTQINFIAIVILIILIPFFIKVYLPSYFTEKGKNLATKEDIKEITDKIESVKTYYTKEIEAYKKQLELLEKRQEISAQVIDLINRYKEIPTTPGKENDEILRNLEKDYFKLVPWIPSEILLSLNALFLKETPERKRPDIKDVIINVRKAILGNEAGDFKGSDLIHFVEFKK